MFEPLMAPLRLPPVPASRRTASDRPDGAGWDRIAELADAAGRMAPAVLALRTEQSPTGDTKKRPPASSPLGRSSMPRTFCVYVGKDSTGNFNIGRSQQIWGWK